MNSPLKSPRRRCLQLVLGLFAIFAVFIIRAGSTEESGVGVRDVWDKQRILYHLKSNPSRAYFADLFAKGGFKVGMEVGVADGRFSEHFLHAGSGKGITWYMIEPNPNERLRERFTISDKGTANFLHGSWASANLTSGAHLVYFQELSTDKRLIRDIPDESFDFIYLDGAHDYENVALELF